MLFDGELPHLSSKVRYIKPGYKRVILGLNCFPEALHECCSRAPEHSDAFNRTIKLYQAMASVGNPITAYSHTPSYTTAPADQSNDVASSSVGPEANESSQKKGIDVKDIMKNPALAKLLVMAAKRVKAKSNNS